MTLYVTDNVAGSQGILDISSTPLHTLGTIRRFQDSTSGAGSAGQGAGEVIYLTGCAATIKGSVVRYNPRDGSTTLVPINTKNTGWPVAVAMAANASTAAWSWYQIAGVAEVAKGVVDFGTAASVYTSNVTAGYVTVTAGSGNQVLGAVTANSASVSSTTSTIFVTINRPHLQGLTDKA